jgi:hypothetical protein
MEALFRPTQGFTPWEIPDQKGVVVFLREVSNVRRKVNELWAFGERPFRNSNGDWAFQSVAIQLHGVYPVVWVDATENDGREEWSVETVQALVRQLPMVQSWDIEPRHRGFGFDYNRIDHGLQRPYIKLAMRSTAAVEKLLEAVAAPLRDHCNVPRKLHVSHSEYSLPEAFLHVNNVRLQSWLCFSHTNKARQSVTTSSYDMHWKQDEGTVTELPSEITPNFAPALCASIRTRFDAGGVAPSLPPEEGDNLKMLCSDVYWNGHEGPVLQVRLYVDPMLRKPTLPAVGPNMYRLVKPYKNEVLMVRGWRDLMNRLDIDVWVTLEDFTSDRLQILMRLPDHNLGKFKGQSESLRPDQNREGVFWYRTPGRSEVDVGAYMERHLKGTVKPAFEDFTLLAAFEHPKMYDGPEIEGVEHFDPFALLPLGQQLQEVSLEAAIVRGCEAGPSIVNDATAISNRCGCSLTDTVGRGVSIRCAMRLNYDYVRWGFVRNAHEIDALILTRPVEQFNDLPTPPELPNVPLEKRGPDFQARWSRAVRHSAEQERLLTRYLGPHKDPPLPEPDPEPDVKSTPRPSGPRKRKNCFGLAIDPHDTKRGKTAQKKPKKYEGGLVREPIVGFYATPTAKIATLDFASLYPTIFINSKVDACAVVRATDAAALADPRLTIMAIPITPKHSVFLVTHVDGKPVPTVVPRTQKELVAARGAIKKDMKTEEKRRAALLVEMKLPHNTKLSRVRQAVHAETEPGVATQCYQAFRDYDNYDKKQLGAKIVQNGMYGFWGMAENGKYVAAMICAIGRWLNLVSGWYVVRFYQGAIIYGDTDSIMVQLIHTIVGEMVADNKSFMDLSTQVADELSTLLTGHTMEFECMSWPYLAVSGRKDKKNKGSKKTYAYTFWTIPEKYDYHKISGFAVIKRSNCPWAREVARTLFEMLLSRKAVKEWETYLGEQALALMEDRVPVAQLSISCALKDNYVSTTLPQITIANKIEARQGYRPAPGRRVSYVVLEGTGNIYNRVETPEQATEAKLSIDKHHIFKQLTSAFPQIFAHVPAFRWKAVIERTQRQVASRRSRLFG